jgi:Ca2+-transporting ATPase
MDRERAHIASEIRESRSWHSLAIRNVISKLGSDLSALREEEARSLVFASIILFELTFVFSCRSQSQTILSLGLTSNKYLVAAVLSQLMLLLLILYTPSIASLFEVSPIAFGNWSTVIAAGISGFIFAETAKAIAGRLRR